MVEQKPASLLSLCVLVYVTEGQSTFTAEPGQNITLTGHVNNSLKIRVIECTRHDLKTDYVFVYRDNQPDPDSQHPSFKERVELGSQMKDGDVSVTLKNVTFNDTGTYECCVFLNESKAPELISTVHLRVSAGHRNGHKDGGDKGGGDQGGGDQGGGDQDGGDQGGGDQDGGDQGGGDQGGGDQDGGDQDGGDKRRGRVGLIVAVVLFLVVVVGLVFYIKCRCQRAREQVSVQQPVDGESVQHLV